MARPPRYFLPGYPLHVIQRGNNRSDCFITDDDRRLFLAKLAECAARYEVAIHNFVLMSNHFHLLVTPHQEHGLSRCMQRLGSVYVPYFNRVHERTGTLWEGRFRTFLVDSEHYFFTLCRYIEQNPVRAGMVRHCAEHPWSSYHANARGVHIRMLTPHHMYQALGPTAEARRHAYMQLFTPVEPERLREIRSAVNRGIVLGRPEFRRDVEKRLGINLDKLERGGDRKSPLFRMQAAASSQRPDA